MRLLALFPARLNPDGIGSFIGASLGDGWEVTGAAEALDDAGVLQSADVLFGISPMDAPAIEQAGNLKFIQTPSLGYDHIDLEAAAARGIPVCNAGASGEAGTVAEHAMLLMLACARRIIDGHAGIQGGDWPQLVGSTIELHGKTLGIVGLGSIGREVAKRAHAFGMHIVYCDPVAAPADLESSLGLERTELADLLRRSDVVSVHTFLNASTRGLIGAGELAMLRDGAILVNTARGPIVDNAALAEATKDGRISAGIDVFDVEPPGADHPLRSAANVIVSPHLAGTTRESVGRIMNAAIENLQRFGRGEAVIDIVNGVTP